ncbi:hypothetical protein, partial [Roseovarius sp. D0-M9]|uniref:hypothetical protein n=1 Tax=Roseovarius sp. D0-M9 TaxID=3127117 RepID=UPI00300FAF7F
RRSAQAPARVTLRHNIWCGRELTGDPHTHTNREEAVFWRFGHLDETLFCITKCITIFTVSVQCISDDLIKK